MTRKEQNSMLRIEIFDQLGPKSIDFIKLINFRDVLLPPVRAKNQKHAESAGRVGREAGRARLCPPRLGSARLGSARLGSAQLGSARLSSSRLGFGSARLGLAGLFWYRPPVRFSINVGRPQMLGLANAGFQTGIPALVS